jgi:hypothetical protein
MAVALLLIPAGAARGAEVGLFGSYWDIRDLGRSMGLGARFDLSFSEKWALRFGATLARQREEARVKTRVSVEGLDLDSTLIDLGFVRRRSTWGAGAYGGAGLTYYLLDASRGNAEDDVGAHVQLGYQFEGHLFVELFYRYAKPEVTNFTHRDRPHETFSFDADLSGFGFSLGWTF